MIKEDQVCDLKYARKLKELRVKQESIWYWIVDEKTGEVDLSNGKPIVKGLKFYSAFTCSELGEMLPRGYASHKLGDEWYCLKREKDRDTRDETEANARAKMLIYLLENGLIKI